ncbi:MAG: hypothetical protein VKL39_24445, partial [Leptolyngbyaceae bacterium]|nr:hypothetical protein [Leptolyngbyaceae bacterium]
MPFDPSQITGDAFGATDPQVFWGYNQNPMPGYMIDAGAPANYKQPVTLTASNAVGYLYQIAQQNPSEYEAYRQRMMNAGLIDKYASGADMQRVWEAAVGASAQAFASGTNLTPWDAIDLLGSSYGQDPSKGPRNGTYSTAINRTSTTSDTNRRVDLSSESEARA